MNEKTDAKETRSEGSPAGGTTGKDLVFQVFRQIGTPVKTLIWAAVATLILPPVAMLAVFYGGAFFILPSILVLIALPFVPGIIVYREFRDEVVPACRGVCFEKEIVSGALKSLRFLWERYFLCLFPGIALAAGLIVFFVHLDNMPFHELGRSISLCLFVSLLGEFALALFPVARLFSRRVGMIVMLILIILGQIVLMRHALLGASGFIDLGGHRDAAIRFNAFTGFWSFICITLYACSFVYFIHAAYTDAETEGLLYWEMDLTSQTQHQEGPKIMNEKKDTKENTNTKAPRTESPPGTTLGAKYVLSVFRENKMSLIAMICVSVIMEIIILFFFMIDIPQSSIALLVLLALTFAPGVLVHTQFKHDVIPVCRGICNEEEIVSGAWKSLLYMWEVCFLCMIPLVVLALKKLIFHDPWTGHPYEDFGGSIVMCYVVAILGDCPLALFPVAQMFSRRVGMIVMFILIILGQVILLLNALLLRIGFPYFTDGKVMVNENNAFSGTLSTFSIMLYLFAFGYFLYVSYTDAKEQGLLY